MRILYLCAGRSFYTASCGRKLNGILSTWRSNGHEVLHVCGGDMDQLGKTVDPNINGQVPPQRHHDWKRLQPLVHSVSEHRDINHNRVLVTKLETLATDFSPELICERSCRLHDCGLRLSKKLGIPYVLEWKDHLVDYPLSIYRSRALRMESRKNQQCDWMVVESEKLKHDLARDEKVDTAKILVAHNAVDAEEFAPLLEEGRAFRKSLCVADNTVLIGYLGSYAFYHDAKRLVLAADLLRQKMPGEFLVLMIGNGKELAETKALAKQLNLLDNPVKMLPRVGLNEVPKILSALDIAVLPGSTEIICPIKIQEYMASETATVAPDFPCNREVIEHGVDGVLFQPGNERSLAERIVELATDSKQRNLIAMRGRKKMIERYSWQATWGNALELIVSNLNGNDLIHAR